MTEPSRGRELLAKTTITDRLAAEPIIWLTTVSADSRPHSVPVWFHWADPVVTVFSQAATAKVQRLRLNPAVSVSLDSARHGTDTVLGEGDAELVDRTAVSNVLPDFERKYRPMLAGQSFNQWLDTSQPIVVRLSKIIAWTRTPSGLDYHSIPVALVPPGTSPIP